MQVVPFANYPGRFASYPGALKTGDKVAPEGCIKQCEGALMLGAIAQRQEDLGKLVGVSRSLVAGWIGGFRHPAPGYQTAIEKRLGIPGRAWSLWRPSTGQDGATAPAEDAPISSERPTAAVPREEASAPAAHPVLDLPEGTDVKTQRAIVKRALMVLGTGSADTARLKLLLATIDAEEKSQIEELKTRPLDEHPDFESFLCEIEDALRPIPGALMALAKCFDRNGRVEQRAAA